MSSEQGIRWVEPKRQLGDTAQIRPNELLPSLQEDLTNYCNGTAIYGKYCLSWYQVDWGFPDPRLEDLSPCMLFSCAYSLIGGRTSLELGHDDNARDDSLSLKYHSCFKVSLMASCTSLLCQSCRVWPKNKHTVTGPQATPIHTSVLNPRCIVQIFQILIISSKK